MRQHLRYGFVVAAALALAGCGGPLQYKVSSSRLAPGADADITATVNSEQNQTALVVHATNLPPPGRVNPNAKHYVGWARKGNTGVWSRLGTVKFDEEKRTAELTATVPEQDFDFELSAEADEGVQSPSADVVFSQHVAR
jgi:predicted small lipoprotein YifL